MHCGWYFIFEIFRSFQYHMNVDTFSFLVNPFRDPLMTGLQRESADTLNHIHKSLSLAAVIRICFLYFGLVDLLKQSCKTSLFSAIRSTQLNE